MAIEMRADDLMPWGKNEGKTLRQIFVEDKEYYEYLIGRPKDYIINDITKEILLNGVDKEDKSKPIFSKGARLLKQEFFPDDVVPWSKHDGCTLYEAFCQNESFYRSLVASKKYFISQKTFEAMMKLKYGEGSVKHKTKQEIDQSIINKINGFEFTEEDVYTDEDIIPYIGEVITEQLTSETLGLITSHKKKNTFNLRNELEQIYGKDAKFRNGQEEAILSVLSGKKTLVVQHTGWGKSLVYFLAIKVLRKMGKGPALLISPLLALMHNQIEATEQFGLNAKAITSDTKKEWKKIYSDIKKNKIDVIIISPERLGDESFVEFFETYLSNISLFAVDEAHCISDWGHDFRPDFRRIVKYIRKLPDSVAVLATTATANDRVVRDIKFQLGKDLEIMRGTMERKSINIDVLNLGSDDNKINWMLSNIPKFNGVGIVYCLTIHDCEEVVDALCGAGINAEIYHARLDVEIKKEIEQRFQENEIDVLVATIAFGMGIDKKDIKYVIHYQQPASAVAYYQQIGRAGRAIPHAYAVLLVGDEDNEINKYFIMNAFPTENEMNRVVECITDNPGISRNEIVERLDATITWADKILKYLLVNGDIYKKNYRYFKTSKEWVCDMKRARIVSWHRWRELRRFNEFIETNKCYMQFIREELDDSDAKPCGHCSNCMKKNIFN